MNPRTPACPGAARAANLHWQPAAFEFQLPGMKKTVIPAVAGAALFAGGYWRGTSRSGAPDERKDSIAAAIAARSGAGASPKVRAAAEKEVQTFAPGKRFAKGHAKEWLLALAASLGGDNPDRGNEMAFVEAVQIFLTMDEASALEAGAALKELLLAYEAGDAALKAIHEGDDMAQAGLMLTMVRLAQINPATALTMLQGLPEGGTPSKVMRVVIGRLAAQDPARAEQMALTLPEQQRRGALEGIMYSIGRKDPAAALEMAARYPQEISDHDRNRLLQQWARRDPPAAMGGAVKVMEQSGDNGAVRQIFEEFLRKDSKAAAQWAATHPGPGATTMQAMLLEERASGEPQSVLAEYAALQQSATNQEELVPLASVIADSLANKDPVAARDWTMVLPDGEGRSAAIQQVAEQWVRQDAPAASEWIKDLPAGSGRDRAVSQLTSAIRRRDPAAAFEWARSIQNTDLRIQSTAAALRTWNEQDPDAAKVARDALPEAERGK